MSKRLVKMAIFTQGAEFDGDSIEKRGVGGAESAVTYMARELAKLGHTIHVYCRCKSPGIYNGVEYRSSVDVSAVNGYEVLIASRFPAILERSDAKLKLFISHDMPVLIGQVQVNLWCMDRFICLSQFQVSEWRKEIPLLDRISYVSRNGVDIDLATKCVSEIQKGDYVVWASRPERGLDVLLEQIWPQLNESFPSLKLIVGGYEGVEPEGYEKFFAHCRKLVANAKNLEQAGSLPKKEWYELLAGAKLVLYPSRFPEISCILGLEAQAVGTPLVTTDEWAPAETVVGGVLIPRDRFYAQNFINAATKLLTNKEWYEKLRQRGVASVSGWGEIASEWEELIYSELDIKENMPLPTLSVCMIARDEELNIAKSIRSVKLYADQILVYDAGSEDGTAIVALSEGATVIPGTSDPDGDGLFNFGWARNQVIEKAIGAWILQMDSDEILHGGENLAKYLRARANDAFRIKQNNLSLDANKTGHETPIRLFRRVPGVEYIGTIHEQPVFDQEAGTLPLLGDVELIHFGYVLSEESWVKFEARNAALLVKEKRLNPNRPMLPIYELRDLLNYVGREVARRGLTQKAIDYLTQVVYLWRRAYNGPKCTLPHEDLAWGLYQKALAILGSYGIPVGTNQPFLVEWLVGIVQSERAAATPKRIWFLTPEDLKRFMETRTQKAVEWLEEYNSSNTLPSI